MSRGAALRRERPPKAGMFGEKSGRMSRGKSGGMSRGKSAGAAWARARFVRRKATGRWDLAPCFDHYHCRGCARSAAMTGVLHVDVPDEHCFPPDASRRTRDLVARGAVVQLTSKTSGFDETVRAFVREVVREELAGRAATSDDRDRYLATAAAAELAGVAEGTIRRWVREGRVPGHRAGRVLRVRSSDVHRLLSSGGRAPRTHAALSPEELARRNFGLLKG